VSSIIQFNSQADELLWFSTFSPSPTIWSPMYMNISKDNLFYPCTLRTQFSPSIILQLTLTHIKDSASILLHNYRLNSNKHKTIFYQQEMFTLSHLNNCSSSLSRPKGKCHCKLEYRDSEHKGSTKHKLIPYWGVRNRALTA